MPADDVKTRKLLITSLPDFISAKSYDNSIKNLFKNNENKRITSAMICKMLALTREEFQEMEKKIMNKLKVSMQDEENIDI